MNQTLQNIIITSINPLFLNSFNSLLVKYNEENHSYELRITLDGNVHYIGSINLIGSGYFDASQSHINQNIIAIIENHLRAIVQMAKTSSDSDTRSLLIKDYFENNVIN